MILRYAGVDDVRLLDGGYDWWVRDGNPLETDPARADAGRRLRRADPAPAGGHRRHRRGQGDHRRPGRRGARQRPDLARAHRRGQRLQLHRPGRPDQGRRLGQLRHRRLPHAALPQRRQHDARLPGDRRQLGRGRDHAPTSGSRSTAAPAGGPARPGSTPTSRTGRGSRSTTAAGSSGARTRSTTRSRSASPRSRRRTDVVRAPGTPGSPRSAGGYSSVHAWPRTRLRLAIVGAGDVAYRHYLPALAGWPIRSRSRRSWILGPGPPSALPRASPTGHRTRGVVRSTSTRCWPTASPTPPSTWSPAPRHGPHQPGHPRRRCSHLYSEKPIGGRRRRGRPADRRPHDGRACGSCARPAWP